MSALRPLRAGRERRVLGIASWLMALCGAWLLVSSTADLLASGRAGSWPVTEGSIAEVQTSKVLAGRFLPLQNRITVSYEYSVGPVRYRGSRVSFDGIFPRELAPETLVPGGRVTVHYHPGNPGEAVLHTGWGVGLWVYATAGLFFLIAGGVLRRFTESSAAERGSRRGKRR